MRFMFNKRNVFITAAFKDEKMFIALEKSFGKYTQLVICSVIYKYFIMFTVVILFYFKTGYGLKYKIPNLYNRKLYKFIIYKYT